jgi:hypothetical protein
VKATRDFSVKLSTGRWDYVLEPICGITVYDKIVVIKPSRENRDRLDTFVHETLHASCKGMSEAEVTRVAADLAKVLWRAGYRRTP